MYAPKSFAHLYVTLTDKAEMTYRFRAQTSRMPSTGFAGTSRPVGIKWPVPVLVISQKDMRWPLLPGQLSSRCSEHIFRTWQIDGWMR